MAILSILFAFKSHDRTTIYIIGDSTAANKQERVFPETGWGMAFAKLFSAAVKVDNRALNGRSSKSFKQDIGNSTDTVDHWKPIVENLDAGDYVFIEFGHNDEKVDKPNVGTSLMEFEQNLIFYITETRKKGGVAVLLTPIARRKFKNGVLMKTHGDYPDVTRKVAKNMDVPLIDMEEETNKLLTSYGDEKSKDLFLYVKKGDPNYPDGKQDDTHLSPIGAGAVADLVAKGIKALRLPLKAELIDKQ
mgnify:CR=1 FL=1